MLPEEKLRIIAETEKLKVETVQLTKGGWGKPSSWVPILVAFSAIMTSFGQFQYSAIKEKELILNAREKVIEAREHENQLMKRNRILEAKINELLSKIQTSKSNLFNLKERMEVKNIELLILEKEGKSKINIDAEHRKKMAKEIYDSIKNKDINSEINKLIFMLSHKDKLIRKKYFDMLFEKYKSNPLAISLALSFINNRNIDNISVNGVINILNFLKKTEPNLWNESLINQAFLVINFIKEMGDKKIIYIGKITEATLKRFAFFINTLKNGDVNN